MEMDNPPFLRKQMSEASNTRRLKFIKTLTLDYKDAELNLNNFDEFTKMEDSGIDSEDKVKEIHGSDEDSPHNLEVAFKGLGHNKTTTVEKEHNTSERRDNLSSCKILQRKLELKVERAKRNYNQFQEENAKKPKSSNLIPINRLQIPGYSENQPLVDYKSESDDGDEISFFPAKSKSARRQELTDTFSIQEMTIESDNSDDSESQNLELLPPSSNRKFLDKMLNCFYCCDNTT